MQKENQELWKTIVILKNALKAKQSKANIDLIIEEMLENKGEDQSKKTEQLESHDHNPHSFLSLAQI